MEPPVAASTPTAGAEVRAAGPSAPSESRTAKKEAGRDNSGAANGVPAGKLGDQSDMGNKPPAAVPGPAMPGGGAMHPAAIPPGGMPGMGSPPAAGPGGAMPPSPPLPEEPASRVPQEEPTRPAPREKPDAPASQEKSGTSSAGEDTVPPSSAGAPSGPLPGDAPPSQPPVAKPSPSKRHSSIARRAPSAKRDNRPVGGGMGGGMGGETSDSRTRSKYGGASLPPASREPDAGRTAATGAALPAPNDKQTASNADNPFRSAADQPLSTIPVDIGTASYVTVRRYLHEGRLPPPEAVRIDEMVNYFAYNYSPPPGKIPFAVHIETAQCPWQTEHRLVRIGLKGREIERHVRGPSVIARNVAIQIEFNPAEVAAYRLIGGEDLALAHHEPDNNGKPAGDVYAGHALTVLYELVPANAKEAGPLEKRPLKYQRAPEKKLTEHAQSGELLTLRLSYKLPEGQDSRLLEVPAKDSGARFGKATADFRFASAVAAFGMVLRNSPYRGQATLAATEEYAAGALGKGPTGQRAEFLELIHRARVLSRDK
jgi:hypothetical protein